MTTSDRVQLVLALHSHSGEDLQELADRHNLTLRETQQLNGILSRND